MEGGLDSIGLGLEIHDGGGSVVGDGVWWMVL
jgi:hypothetical protein